MHLCVSGHYIAGLEHALAALRIRYDAPGLPDHLATQLRSFSGDGTTLPLPVPAQLVETSTAEVDGAPATVLSTQDGTMAAVVWVDDGIVTAVAGSLSTDEVLSVARGLQEQ